MDLPETFPSAAGLPEPLPGDAQRQAIPSITGTVYQAWWSIDAWLRLSNINEAIYLECAEDFDIVRNGFAITVQVRHNEGTISLGNAKARSSLENFWELSCQDLQGKIYFHYLTTSSIAMEKDGKFDGRKGIEVWRAAQTNPDLAYKIALYLIDKLDEGSQLKAFLSSAKPEDIQERLIRRFNWLTNQPDIDAVKQSVDDRITVLLNDKRRSLSLVTNVRKFLESRFWELILKPAPSERRLTLAELLRQVESATTTYLPIKIEQLTGLLDNFRPGQGLLNLLIEKLPHPPEPLLQRPALTKRLADMVTNRKVVLLTGTIHKGKSTAAQMVCLQLCPDAWWINLSGRRIDQVDNVFVALAGRIEKGSCPNLVIIDDLDISPAAHHSYRDSLALILHRSGICGKGIIITARGGTSESAVVKDFKHVEVLDVPELSANEIETLFIEHGCPPEIADLWASIIAMGTGGHPKLVQVRLVELADLTWPRPKATDFTTQSSAITSARKMARHLLSESELGPIAEFVYLISLSSTLIHRSAAIRLAETVYGLTNGGDVLDKLNGKWLECIEGQWFRATALLQGVAADTWSPEKIKSAHIRLHDAIIARYNLSPPEAAAIIFHAYMGAEPRRIALTASRLHLIKNGDAVREVERYLLWLPFIALEAGQSITGDALAAAALRSLQFKVALTLDSECLPQICSRWTEEIEKIIWPEAKAANLAMMWLFVSFSDNPKIPLKHRLEAIMGIQTLPEEHASNINRFFDSSDLETGLPEGGTSIQAQFLCASRNLRDVYSLNELLQWLDNVATVDIRKQFDAMIEWPIVQGLGAFVQSAWAAFHEQTNDWEPWLSLFERINEYAKRRNSPKFGIEAAKAKAIILTEYLSQPKVALTVLKEAEAVFGAAVVLREQRSNVLYHEKDDQLVLEIWSELTSNSANIPYLDPFAYRRAGVSAARLKQWGKAATIFSSGAESILPGSLDVTKFGFWVDAACAISMSGNQADSAKVLARAITALPTEANREGDVRWEAVQRAASQACSIIENEIWKPKEADRKLDPGFASSPDLTVSKAAAGQEARSELTKARILHLVSTIAKDPPKLDTELNLLINSNYSYVRWIASEAQLALAYSTGAGEGFVEALLAFDSNTNEFLVNMQKGRKAMLEPDDGPVQNSSIAPERWFGLLCAGVICSGKNLHSHLKIWLDRSKHLLGENAALTEKIQSVYEGANLSADSLERAIRNEGSPPTIRVGAAARLSQEMLSAEITLQVQVFLTSAILIDESRTRQILFNIHVARCFADSWRHQVRNQFQFYSPITSIPELLKTLDGVEKGNYTLKRVLTAASAAIGQPIMGGLLKIVQ